MRRIWSGTACGSGIRRNGKPFRSEEKIFGLGAARLSRAVGKFKAIRIMSRITIMMGEYRR